MLSCLELKVTLGVAVLALRGAAGDRVSDGPRDWMVGYDAGTHAAGHGTSLPSPQEMSRGEGGRRRKVTGFGGARAASHRREPGSGHARPCLVWGQPGQGMLETSFIRGWRPRLSDARRHLIRRSLRTPDQEGER